ncbi:protein cereblon-like protein [Dinothrombium tinctorium]|uniref:Protein cereblon n=1 Tax=Dinothrombium tinctorium TaxID=1965070 RepID=A0A443QDE8_9ACAR|nr:protein cereblon-like protein [Dinothrombium tinctorium]
MGDELILPLLAANNDENSDIDSEESGSDEDDNRIENDVIGTDDEEDDQSSSSSSDDEVNNNASTASGRQDRRHSQPKAISYDTTLPAQHSYLGSDLEELSGRVVLDDQSFVSIPLLTLRGVILVPGQVLPLQLELPSLVAMMKRIISKDRTFGLTASLQSSSFGTTAEIRSYGEDSDERSGISILRVKAEGSQRFRVVETWRQPDGILMGKVKILPECELVNPLRSNFLLSSRGVRASRRMLAVSTPWPRWVYRMYDPYILMDQINLHLNNWASSGKSKDPLRIRKTTTRESTGPSQDASNMRVTRTIVTTIRTVNDTSDSGSPEGDSDDEGGCFAPSKPTEFSYWVAKNLPLDDSQRLELLSLNCPIQRLRWELSILQKYLYLCCCNCKTKICHRENVFSMSVHGPQDTYVNSAGYVHETLTVYKAESLSLMGRSSTEQTWFPGYAWTICRCSECGNHMGWKFTATNKKLKPESFWGICRSSIEPGFNIDSDPSWKPII